MLSDYYKDISIKPDDLITVYTALIVPFSQSSYRRSYPIIAPGDGAKVLFLFFAGIIKILFRDKIEPEDIRKM